MGFDEQERHTRRIVTRSVSEGKRWPSLAHASGYDVVGRRTITQVDRQNPLGNALCGIPGERSSSVYGNSWNATEGVPYRPLSGNHGWSFSATP
jgi:hypothetical protein